MTNYEEAAIRGNEENYCKVIFTENHRKPTLWGYSFEYHKGTVLVFKTKDKFEEWCKSKQCFISEETRTNMVAPGGSIVGRVKYF